MSGNLKGNLSNISGGADGSQEGKARVPETSGSPGGRLGLYQGAQAHRWALKARRSISTPTAPTFVRKVNALVFSDAEELPFDIKADELIASVAKRIKLPRLEGYRSFKTSLKSSTSSQILTFYFWFLHCKRFKPKDRKLANRLLDKLSEKYVSMFWALKAGAMKDYFLEYYPYAIAAAVNEGMYQHFEGSRDLFTDDFQNSVFRETLKVISGVDASLDAMQQKREQLSLCFIEKERSMVRGGGGSEATEQGEGGAGGAVDHFAELTEEDIKSELHSIPGYVERKIQRLQRTAVDALKTSPLVKHYTKAIAESNRGGKKRGATLKRTVTDPNCQFGGEETFVRTTSRVEEQEEMHKKWLENKVLQKQHMQGLRRSLRQDLHLLDQSKTSLLKHGNAGKAISQFVEDLVESKLHPSP